MKRIFLAWTILICGGSALWAVHRATTLVRREAERAAGALKSETLRMGEMRTQLSAVTIQVRELKERLETEQGASSDSRAKVLEVPAGSAHLEPELSEQLLDRLGFNWGSSSDYLMVSKDTLRAISLEGMHGTKVSDAAAQVLAMTSEERAGIETTTQQLMADYNSWVQSHALRTEPNGDVVAQYTLPSDPDFSLSLSNRFASGVLGSIGTERGGLLLDYSRSWMLDLGMGGAGGANSLKVTRYPGDGEPHYSLQLKYSGNTMSTDVSRYQPFPAAFLPLFPGGWPDLARRESFPLPSNFQK